MKEWGSMITRILEVLHWLAVAAGVIILLLTVFSDSANIDGTVLEKIYKTGVVYDEVNQRYVTNDVSVYGLDIVGTYEPEKTISSTVSENFETGEHYSNVKVEYCGGRYNTAAIIVYTIGCIINLTLMALVFSNIHSVIKRSLKEGERFNKEQASALRNTGIILLEVVGVTFITSIIAGGMTGKMNININIIILAIGLFVICLSEYFDYGNKLEEKVSEQT